MITVPAGQVTLSDRRTQRSWAVELAPYRLAASVVTQAQYARVTGERPSTAQGDRLPVEGVSWLDAVRFCNALSLHEGLTPAYRTGTGTGTGTEDGAGAEGVSWDAAADGYRLPAEAEWEHACRGRHDGRAVRPARRHRLASRQFGRADARGGHKAAQRLGTARHLGQCLGVVLGRLRRRGLRQLPGAARRRLVRRALELPGLGAAPQPPDLPDRRHGVPGGTFRPVTIRTASSGASAASGVVPCGRAATAGLRTGGARC